MKSISDHPTQKRSFRLHSKSCIHLSALLSNTIEWYIWTNTICCVCKFYQTFLSLPASTWSIRWKSMYACIRLAFDETFDEQLGQRCRSLLPFSRTFVVMQFAFIIGANSCYGLSAPLPNELNCALRCIINHLRRVTIETLNGIPKIRTVVVL